MRWLHLAAALAAAVLLAACSSEPQSPPTTSQPTPTGHGALATCLSEHGVAAAPGPAGGPPPGVDPNTWQRAMQACSTLEPGPAG